MIFVTFISDVENKCTILRNDIPYYQYLHPAWSGLPNKAVDVLSSMGITCSSKTARKLIKIAGTDCDGLVLRILNHQKELLTSEQALIKLVSELSRDPYLYFGENTIPHKLVLNGNIINHQYRKKLFFRKNLITCLCLTS